MFQTTDQFSIIRSSGLGNCDWKLQYGRSISHGHLTLGHRRGKSSVMFCQPGLDAQLLDGLMAKLESCMLFDPLWVILLGSRSFHSRLFLLELGGTSNEPDLQDGLEHLWLTLLAPFNQVPDLPNLFAMMSFPFWTNPLSQQSE